MIGFIHGEEGEIGVDVDWENRPNLQKLNLIYENDYEKKYPEIY